MFILHSLLLILWYFYIQGFEGFHVLTLKWLGHIFQNVISFSDALHLMCNISSWNWSNTMNV